MFVYCIYLGENFVYYGSTNNLSKRQTTHNVRLRSDRYNSKLYVKARELGTERLDLIQLYEGDEYADIENELILSGDEYCLNHNAVMYDRQRALKLHREAQARYILKLKSEN